MPSRPKRKNVRQTKQGRKQTLRELRKRLVSQHKKQLGFTTLVQSDGVFSAIGTGISITTVTVDKGTFYYSCTGTITTLNVGSQATANFTGDLRSKTVSNTNLYSGARYIDSFSTTINLSNFKTVRCGLPDVTVDVGKNRTFSIT